MKDKNKRKSDENILQTIGPLLRKLMRRGALLSLALSLLMSGLIWSDIDHILFSDLLVFGVVFWMFMFIPMMGLALGLMLVSYLMFNRSAQPKERIGRLLGRSLGAGLMVCIMAYGLPYFVTIHWPTAFPPWHDYLDSSLCGPNEHLVEVADKTFACRGDVEAYTHRLKRSDIAEQATIRAGLALGGGTGLAYALFVFWSLRSNAQHWEKPKRTIGEQNPSF